jgi:hypothetical protein
VEGDIKGCFDNIDHAVLVSLINAKIKDTRLIKLIYKFLKAGYMENWRYNNTYSGTPQGGIISPLLANIYLHELDKFVMKLKADFDKPRTQWHTPEYSKARYQVESVREQLKNADETEKSELLTKLKAARAVLLKTPCKSQTDKQIKYIRYADDFLIGVNGSKEDCEWIKSKLAEFIRETLKMELSEEKTLITHSNNYARFLGYDVRVRRDGKIKHGSATNCTKRTLNNMTELMIPFADKIHKFMFSKGVVEQRNGQYWPVHRKYLLHLTDLEIVSTYNAELRGICNYYSMASNFCNLNYFEYLMGYSCLKTLAAKHKCPVAKVKRMFKDGKGGWGIPYETKQGKKRLYLAKYADSKTVKNPSDNVERTSVIYAKSTTTLESRLKAKVCELCGTEEAEHYDIHHINKVKNLKGKEPWERVMIAKRRKTLVVCEKCHIAIHN